MDALLDMRAQKDEFFKNSPHSPLQPDQQATFDGLRYYDLNPALDFELVAEPYEDQEHIRMQTTTGDLRAYMRWGCVRFTVNGQSIQLTLYYQPGQPAFFVPFMDSTNGTETYSGGRYVEAEQLPDGKVHLDFNLAYNAYCAYSPRWSCPIPPLENRLNVPIEAGEKTPVGEWIDKGHE